MWKQKHLHKQKISIHALREEGDVTQRIKGAWPTYFYPRPPRGGRQCSQSNRLGTKKFLSTPSARRATCKLRNLRDFEAISIHALREEGDLRCPPTPSPTSNFYPRPPRGGRPIMATTQLRSSNFYPRPPRGGRRFKRDYSLLTTIFLSTPSARRATTQQDTPQKRYTISIHALREEGDYNIKRVIGAH